MPTVARLLPGMTAQRLADRLQPVLRGWEAAEPQFYSLSRSFYLEARPFVVAWSGRLRPIVVSLIGAAGFLLLIACANVGALLVLRVTGRSRDIAVRMALGASRMRILATLGTETAMLATVAGASPHDLIVIVAAGALRLGVLGAAIGAIVYVFAQPWLRTLAYGVDAAAVPLVGAVIIALVAIAVIASLPAAFRASRIDPIATLRAD